MRILCFGDSNTYGYDPRSFWRDRYEPEYRWVDILAEKTGWKVLNAGMNGREIPSEAGRTGCLSQMESADLLIVMLGTNDLLQGADAGSVSDRMEAFLGALTIEKQKLLLIAPPPMKPGQWVTDRNLLEQSEILGQHYRLIARKLSIGFADAGAWDIPLAFDGVHFTQEGHQRFASGLLGVFAQIPGCDPTAT